MKLYPSIYVKNGYCVKLRQGHFRDTEVYLHTPSNIAQNFELLGASCIHIVDLDGVLAGRAINAEIIKQIVDSISIPVQVGGGIRTIKDIESMLNLGVERVIIGTAAVTNPAFIKDAINTFGADRVIVAIDAKDGMATVDGWGKVSGYHILTLAIDMKAVGVKTIIYTDILRESQLLGPNATNASEILAATNLDIIVAGGISSLKDLEVINSIGVHGAVIGNAIYENRLDLKLAIELFEKGEIEKDVL